MADISSDGVKSNELEHDVIVKKALEYISWDPNPETSNNNDTTCQI
jgi:hypothetical protein